MKWTKVGKKGGKKVSDRENKGGREKSEKGMEVKEEKSSVEKSVGMIEISSRSV